METCLAAKKKTWRAMELCEGAHIFFKWKRLENILYSKGKTLVKRIETIENNCQFEGLESVEVRGPRT